MLLKRNDEEYELFTRMDAERYQRENKDKVLDGIVTRLMAEQKKAINVDNINYRLFQEWEVPEWVKAKPVDPNQD